MGRGRMRGRRKRRKTGMWAGLGALVQLSCTQHCLSCGQGDDKEQLDSDIGSLLAIPPVGWTSTELGP
jgi:hypothetical protein